MNTDYKARDAPAERLFPIQQPEAASCNGQYNYKDYNPHADGLVCSDCITVLYILINLRFFGWRAGALLFRYLSGVIALAGKFTHAYNGRLACSRFEIHPADRGEIDLRPGM